MQRINHQLKANAETHVPNEFITFDTETKKQILPGGSEKHTLKLGVARYYRLMENGSIIRDEIVFHKKEDFFDWIESKIRVKTKVYLFAHNTQFDSQIVDMFKVLPKRNWELKKEIIDTNLFIAKWQKGKSAQRIGDKITKSNKRTLYVLDTFNYFKTSIKEMGKKLGVAKGIPMPDGTTLSIGETQEEIEEFFETATLEQLTAYCKRDVEITELMLLEFFKFLKENDLGNFQPTIASQAFQAFRHRFMHHAIMIHCNPDAIKLERDSYRGGRNEAFFLGEIKEHITVLDFNSLYPSVMIDNEYPTELVGVRQYNTLRTLRDDMENYLVIANVKIKIEQPLIGLRRERLIFPIGTYWTTLCSPELEVLLERDCILDVKEVACYKSEKIFAGYVDFFYKKRLEAKKNNDLIMSEMIKIFLNSLYGKFGQLKKENIFIGKCDISEIYSKDAYNEETNEHYTIKAFAGKVIEVHNTKDEVFNSFPAIASFCTSYARMKLLSAIEKAGWKNVFYCDTDSLFVNDIGLEKLKDMIDEHELGKLKVEYDTDYFNIHGCKDYEVNIKGKRTIKIKGIPKNAKLITEGEFKGDYQLKKFSKFATCIGKGQLDHIELTPMRKHLSRNYTKGIKSNEGYVLPIVINEE